MNIGLKSGVETPGDKQFQLLNKWMYDVWVEVISCHISGFDIMTEDGPS